MNGLAHSQIYIVTITTLLAIGLYGSSFSIDLEQARTHLKLIASAVTIGVVLKALMIGGVMYGLTHDPRSIVIGIAVAQIDPLSVSTILDNDKMSSRAKTILAAWASFDDPVTALLTFYGPIALGGLVGLDPESSLNSQASANWTNYLVDLFWNIVLVLGALGVWRLVKHSKLLSYTTVGCVLAIAVDRFLMLGVATSGLFLRPPSIGGFLKRVVKLVLMIAGTMMGMMLTGGIDLVHGVLLGVVTYCAQITVGFLLTRKLPHLDRWHLAFAQQNGLTAIILALLLEAHYRGVVEIVAPAIVTTNLVHAIANAFLDRRIQGLPAEAG